MTLSEVKIQILSIPKSKSHELYSCPTQLLKYACDVISPVLSDILNTSVSLGAYPQKLKMLNIIPIVKADDETDTSNYRPISLLSNFNRIFEKIMYDRMRDFIEKAQPIIFVSIWFSSSSLNPTCYSWYCRNYTNQYGQKTLFMWRFYCLKKAFDTMNHTILLDKLNYYCFRWNCQSMVFLLFIKSLTDYWNWLSYIW